MMIRRTTRLAAWVFAMALLGAAPARAETCSADSFGEAVDSSAAELRVFSAETQPKLKAKLQELRDHKGWTDAAYEARGLKLIHDAELDAFDAQAGELLSKIDTLGSPETDAAEASATCENLAELKAASSELMTVMRAKSAYLIAKIDREIAASGPGRPTETARTETPSAPDAAPAFRGLATDAPAPAEEASRSTMAAEPQPDLSPLRRTAPVKEPAQPPAANAAPTPPAPPAIAKTETAPAAPLPSPPSSPPTPPAVAEAPPPADFTPGPHAVEETDGDERTSSWNTTTAQAVIPPPPMAYEHDHEPPPVPREPNYDAPPPGAPYALPPPIDEEASGFDADGGGYTVDEIREASRGFFGTVSTSLASVIEHTFQKAGRPTAYVLGNEGGGAFLAGLRYGEGTLYLRSGGSQKVYWHGPSLGYDVGASGSRTLFLIYDLHEPNALFRRFTGVDGSAYLVGGVGMTLLKGGDVTMAPIRSGLGLRIGASIGYVRFSSRPTWNPF
ncbi:EipA family protein [Hyphomicrobium sp.]|uniref:EipA family protein n=1 Tax=Hyphomicrobium sp. TaxID=82 RepID=UPI002FDD4D13